MRCPVLLAHRSYTTPVLGLMMVTWDALDTSPAGYNNVERYYSGGATLAHEVVHFLGVEHTFGAVATGANATCSDDDDVSDTPTTLGTSVRPGECRISILRP